MSQPPRCPSCSGSNLTIETQLKSESNNKSLELAFQGPDASWSDPGKKFYAVNRGRACLDCGYVILQLSPGALVALRLEVETLTTVPEDD